MKFHVSKRACLLLTIVLLLTNSAFNQNSIKIMPLGNSITEGYTDGSLPENQMKSYRYGLKYLLEGAGYNVDFVGSQENGSAFFSDCQHAGIGGSRDQYVARLLVDGYDARNDVQILIPPRPYLDEYNPDIILLHIGTNDVTHEPDVITNQQVSTILDLVDQYEARAQKEVTVFLALIINRKKPCVAGSGCSTTSDFNNYIKTMAQSRINAGDKIVIVDMEHDAGFLYDDTDMADNLHPNATGYNKMAALWYAAITTYYNTPPVVFDIPNQNINEGADFSPIHLDDYVTDVEDPDENITWSYNQLGTSYLNISINQNRIATITPKDSNWSGSQSVVFKATDRGVNGGFQKSDSDTVTFTISPVNDPPVITSQRTLLLNEDTNIILSLSDFTIYDPDSDPSTFRLTVLPGDNYSVNGLTVTPSQDYDGILAVSVAVSDASDQGPVFSAQLTVTPVNDPPEFNGQASIQFDEDTQYTVNLSELSVYDPDNSVSELKLVMQSGNNYSIIGDQIIPKKDYNGTLHIPSFIEDPQHATTSVFDLIVTVNPVNDPPVIISEPELIAVEKSLYLYNIIATDVDDLDLIYNTEAPEWLTFFSNSKLLAGTPKHTDTGFNHVVIRISDGKDTTVQSYYIQVDALSDVTEQIFSGDIVYPNPARDYIIIENDENLTCNTFELYAITGKQVCREKIEPGEHYIYFDIHHLTDGIYFFRLSGNSRSVTGKLLIQN